MLYGTSGHPVAIAVVLARDYADALIRAHFELVCCTGVGSKNTALLAIRPSEI